MSRSDDILAYLTQLRDNICARFEQLDRPFLRDAWQRPAGDRLGGHGEVRMLEGGDLFERAGVALSNVNGAALPASANSKHTHLAGKPFIAMGVSLVVHPKNPFVPTTHMNVRYFSAGDEWWFGGGFDLTPYYPFEDDVRAWHRVAREAAGEHYPTFKKACDEYFYLKHRGETRGVGGLFADDLTGDFDQRFALIRSIGDHFIQAYEPIVNKRKDTPYGDRERAFQAYRRGRYVEFNLVFDRGTSFGLQTGGRTEAILLSMPPHATWRYDWHAQPGSRESELDGYLRPRDWID